jgi:hypothetical protein
MSEPANLPAKSRMPLVLAWLWVGLPLAWGIFQSVLRTRALFQ